jgi:hypothetical protein
MASELFELIPIAQLSLNVDNPRFESKQENKREAMNKMAEDQKEKLARLAGDVAKRGRLIGAV